MRVLVVGDDRDYEQVLRTVMGRVRLQSNLEAVFLRSLADVRNAVHHTSVDVVVSDFSLPDGTTEDLFRALAEHAPTAARVIVTGSPDEAFIEGIAGLPAREVWTKGQPPAELRQRLERLVQLRAWSRTDARRDGGSRPPPPSP